MGERSPHEQAAVERFPREDAERGEESAITSEDLEHYRRDAGLPRQVSLPRPGTPAFERLVATAEAFVRFAGGPSPQMAVAREQSIRRYEDERRERHDALCLMLLGQRWGDLTSQLRRAVSNFAALLTHHDELVGSF